ncbi:hypothetical protein B0A48_18306 [Cryoendolithus antarcticus]|uniref:DUF6987 domain-containing protein n=1 Tax=Cryoendolithus antarcticus TaxID=1507870 RepID=A0A1V8S9R7_9PEZI|nr:hypothetical protein B0A48_18306 [Cryoendolithus antarcticus]
MAPSPAAGKGASAAPKTPTKLGRKPESTPKKLGQPSSSTPKAPATPKAPSAKKPDTSSVSKKAGEAAPKAESAKETAEEAPSKVEMKDDDEDDEEPMSKVSEAGKDGEEQLGEAAPEPVGDDEDDDAVGGATEKAEEATDEAEEAADDDDVADDATEKAGQVGESADEGAEETADETADDATEEADEGKASGLAGNAPKDASKAAGNAKEKTEETAEDAEDAAEETADEGQKVAGETTDEAGEAAEGAEDETEDATEDAEDATDGVDGEEGEEAVEGAKAETEDAAEGAEDEAEEGAEDAEDGAEGAVNGVKEGAEDGAETAEKGAEAADGEAGEAAEGAEDEADGKPKELPLDLAKLKGLEVRADGTVEDAEGNQVAKLAEGDAEDLEGYPIGDNGEILDDDGDLVGRVELLPEEIKRQLQEKRDAGEELPAEADEYLGAEDGEEGEEGEDGEEAEEEDTGLPPLSILEGLTCQVDGLIYDSEGNTVGKVVDGDPEELQNATLNDQGEFIDEEGNVVGHADIHEEAAELVEQGIYESAKAPVGDDEEAEEGDEEVAEDGEEAAEGEAEGIEDELPGIEALEGKELNESGEVVDENGEVLAKIEDEEILQKIADGEIDPATLTINEEGQVVDEEGNVLGGMELEEGAAEKLGKIAPTYDIRILEGRKVNKKGKVIDDDGEEIGQLTEGDPAKCTGKKVNDKGEVLDKNGEVIGKVGITEGEAAETATKDLLTELGEIEPEEEEAAEEEPALPGLDTLEGLKVNKKGQVLNEDGEPIGELTEGDLTACAGRKINDKGEVLDKDGNVIGKVNTLPAPGEDGEEETPEEEQQAPGLDVLDGLKLNKNGQVLDENGDPIGELTEGEITQCAGRKVNNKGEILDDEGNVIGKVQTISPPGEEEEEEGDQLPPLSVLEGLTCNKAGKIIDSNGVIVGELVEGDAKKLAKSGITSDAEGQFWDNKGHVIGRAQTVAVEDAEEESPFAGLEGLKVIEDGWVADENGNVVGQVTEGDPKKLVGRSVDEDGDIIDKKGSVVGHAERYEPEEEAEAEAADLSFLQGKVVNKAGLIIGDDGVPVARLSEGSAKDLAGKKVDDQGQIWNDAGKVIGRVELIPEEERERPEGEFAGLEGLRVIEDGKVADEHDNVVGEVVEGNPKRLIGMAVDEDGDILDKYGNTKGHAQRLPEEEEAVVDNSILDGKTLNKKGYVVDDEGRAFGILVEGNSKELAGRKCDENGYVYGDTGKVAGRCEVLPEDQRTFKEEGPFEGIEGLRVVKGGKVEDIDGNVRGEIVEGNPKRLVGMAVDEDGDILDKNGNVKGHAEPLDEEDPEAPDLSMLAGTTINKAGYAVDGNGRKVGRLVEGDPSTMIGKKVDGEGQVWDNAGNVVGRCEVIHGEDTKEDGPFAGFENLEINKDGTVTTQAGDIIGRITEGDVKKLLGHRPDADGDILDTNGNVIGKAERWEPEDEEDNRPINPMKGMRVNKEGEVRDENGDLVGRLTDGNLGHCVGQVIDENGNVVDYDGNKIGEVTLLENIADDFEGPTEEELEEARKRDEEREVAEKMNGICVQTLERMQPICKQIREHMERADRTPKDELDEDELVNQVKPLIEEGGRILQECNGSLRGLDPDGHIAAQAKGRAGTKEATPEEYQLAENLKELTTTVVTTIDDAKKKLNDMPQAKKKLNPLWGLLTQPLFQILAAVGLLLAGVLGLVGQLLNGLGLGGLVNGLLGGLGVNKLLSAVGLKDDDKKGKGKGKSALSSLPVVGGMLGGGK